MDNMLGSVMGTLAAANMHKHALAKAIYNTRDLIGQQFKRLDGYYGEDVVIENIDYSVFNKEYKFFCVHPNGKNLKEWLTEAELSLSVNEWRASHKIRLFDDLPEKEEADATPSA